uniref:DALR anticodon binding domain-containing protein n=1 Tax=Anopheles dirus TaxID=7168 RepID=A0A182NSD1_9DIPT
MEGLLAKTKKLLQDHLTGLGCSAAIKTLDKNLDQSGDLMVQDKTGAAISFGTDALIVASAGWPLPIAKITFTGNVAHVWFDRQQAYRAAIAAKEWTSPVPTGSVVSKICVEAPSTDAYDFISLSDFRADILRKVIANCYTHAGYTMVEKQTNNDALQNSDVKQVKLVLGKSKPSVAGLVEIRCGPVLTGENLTNAAQYISQRSNDMQLIAQHRYGLRMHDSVKQQKLVASLGRSAAIVDILHTRQTHVIDMRNRLEMMHTQSSSKGAPFILYNYARLASIFKKHDKLAEEDPQFAAPLEDEVDFSLLTEADEWQLLYVYVIGFPGALERTIGYGSSPRIVPYHLLEFTLRLIQCLSKYYCRVRILTANRPKLQPVMFARLRLLGVVYDILKVLLKLLDLEPVEEM